MLKIKTFTFNVFSENTYIISYNNENKDCIIIDPGCMFNNEKNELYSYIKDNKFNPKLLLLTHAHLDHVFGLQFVVDKFNLTPYLHFEEKIILDNLESTCKKYGIPEIKNYNGKVNYFTNDIEFKINNEIIKYFFTPGHSPGSVSYLINNKHLFSGDVLFYESIGRTDLFMGDYEQLKSSIKDQLFKLDENIIVYAGHGEETTIKHEKNNNKFI